MASQRSIFIVCSEGGVNPYIRELARGYRNNGCKVDCGVKQFYSAPLNYDVLHLQWPEALTDWKEPSLDEIEKISGCLIQWKKSSIVVGTVHNLYPHAKSYSHAWEKLFQLIYTNVHGLIHHGQKSIELLNDLVPGTEKIPNAVVPIGNYSCYPNSISKSDARKKLGLLSSEFVFLCFGNIRSIEEQEFLFGAFRKSNVSNKKLLIAGQIPGGNRNAIRSWIRSHITQSFICHDRAILEEEAQDYFNASDIVVVPRLRTLNSGVIPLAFQFIRAVIAPEYGDIGELIEDTSNFTFDPLRQQSLVEAMESAAQSNVNEIGNKNKLIADTWDINQLAKKYIIFIDSLESSSPYHAT